MKAGFAALGEVSEFIRGITFTPSDVEEVASTNTVGVMRTKNVQEQLDLNDVWQIDRKFVKNKNQYLEEGDLLVSSANSWNLVGKASWVPLLNYESSFGGFVTVLRGNKKLVDRRYLYYWFVSERIQSLLRSFSNKTTNISNLSLSRAKELTIPVPPLAEQQRIALLLETADHILRLRESAITKLDELAQSVFADMFGDVIKNNKGWTLKKLSDVTTKLGSGATPRGGDSEYKSVGISLIRSLNVHDGEFRTKNLAYIDDEQADKLSNVVVSENDILLNITGASVARVCRAPISVLPARVNQHVMIVRPSKSLNAVYLEHLLLSAEMKNKLLSVGSSGATREAITKASAENLLIPVPPIEIQSQFCKKFKELENIKSNMLNCLDAIKQLSSSLQNQSFAVN